MASFIPFAGVTSLVKLPSKTQPPTLPKIYTPPNWGKQKALYSITTTNQTTASAASSNPMLPGIPQESSAFINVNNPGIQMFVFDAIRRAQHRLNAVATQHPLQVGFNISDHVVMQPASLTLEVGMSDAIASYSTGKPDVPMWTGNPSKSISAFQTMEALMQNRVLLILNTRLETYYNMVLIGLDTEDTNRTYFGGLSMMLTFQQLFIAQTATSYDSSRVQSSAETTQGTVQGQQPSQAIDDQHKIDWRNIQVGTTTLGGVADTIQKGIDKIKGSGIYNSIITTIGKHLPY